MQTIYLFMGLAIENITAHASEQPQASLLAAESPCPIFLPLM